MDPLKSEIMNLVKRTDAKILIYDAKWARNSAFEVSDIPVVDVASSKCEE